MFYISNIDHINSILIPLFENFSLNGVKYLDYLAFKEAISIKLDKNIPKNEKLTLITKLKNSMNKNRDVFEMPSTHIIKITPYYLLGLIEGEGTFCLNDPKNMGVSFSIALTAVQLPLINAIKDFFDKYMIDDKYLEASPEYSNFISQRSNIHIKKKSTANGKPAVNFSIRQVNYIIEKLIPMLSNLKFITKKYKDFMD